ncbi:phosphatidylinositol-specific phospholipase C1-like protein [Reichenbachiella agariperforans]|uniref:phosphatidylinositol-specific phospholipase C1-like protein n=1 Tax=Reichenbachiella agariperforans TaxID=156994 RepID=UPI001C08DC02|nr:phosphatidylinositol-specific phospholipase C1-like protein [Reichenbachiella agariperforans]MBU2912924.1 phosphatidylinositol-specific phospholipase C1-like protein [Reichenbachiella agariperforans]
MKHLTPILFLFLTAIACQPKQETQESIKLNQMQVIGSHNSYKSGIEPALMQLLIQEDSGAIGLDYKHLPLDQQLDLGLRNLEIDVVYDPEGGRFQQPLALQLMDSLGIPAFPFDTAHELSTRGIKTFHIPDIDFRSHCLTFKGCLSDVRSWSMANPTHFPIIITINPKNSGINKPGYTEVTAFDAQALDSLDAEIAAVFADEELITPGLVQGSAASLREAVLTTGWPALDASRGKVLFVFDAGRELTEQYLQGDVASKPMFVDVEETHPMAAFFIMNDPIEQEQKIRERVKKGYMVRTRADANTDEARNNNYERFEAAKRSGAQVITTDYYVKEINPFSTFQVTFDSSTYERSNPVSINLNPAL